MADLKGLVEDDRHARWPTNRMPCAWAKASAAGMTVIELQVAPGDLGRVIGRQGRTAAAVRTLLATAAEGEGKRATLDIRDSPGRYGAAASSRRRTAE